MGVEGQCYRCRRLRETLRSPTATVLAPLGELHQFEPDLADTRIDQANLPGDTIGYINFAAFLIRSAVINSNHFKLAIARVNDAYEGTEGQVRMSGGQ